MTPHLNLFKLRPQFRVSHFRISTTLTIVKIRTVLPKWTLSSHMKVTSDHQFDFIGIFCPVFRTYPQNLWTRKKSSKTFVPCSRRNRFSYNKKATPDLKFIGVFCPVIPLYLPKKNVLLLQTDSKIATTTNKKSLKFWQYLCSKNTISWKSYALQDNWFSLLFR